MKAPDKIIIFEDGDEQWYNPKDFDMPQPLAVTYIRQDALVEWLMGRNREINGQPHARWRSFQIKEFLDKLNTM